MCWWNQFPAFDETEAVALLPIFLFPWPFDRQEARDLLSLGFGPDPVVISMDCRAKRIVRPAI